MRFMLFALGLCTYLTCAAGQGSVTLTNLTSPFTQLEVSDVAQISISGAAPNSAVTVSLNGGSPYYYGQTDGSGNWSTTSTMTSALLGGADQITATEYWYVGGVALTPTVPSSWLDLAPTLPTFNVYANYSGSNCELQLTAASGCGTGSRKREWVWSPVVIYANSSDITQTVADYEASGWNSVQSQIAFSGDYSIDRPGDVYFYDGSLPAGTLAATTTYGQDCNAECYDYTLSCDGACLNASAMYFATIEVDDTQLSSAASAMGISTSTLSSITAAHEMGHALQLSHAIFINGICSEVQTVMYPDPTADVSCGRTAPNNSCDSSELNTIYPSGVTNCGTGILYCTDPSCS